MVIASCRKPLTGSLMISAKVLCSNHPEEATLPLRWLCQLPLCGLTADERLQAIIHRQQVLYFSLLTAAEKYRSFFIAPRKEVQTKCPYPIWKYELFSEAKSALPLPEPPTKPEKNCFPNMTRKRKTIEENSMKLFTRKSCFRQKHHPNTQTELHSGTLSRKWRSNGTRSLQGGLLLPYPEKCRLKCVLRCCRNIAKSISCPKGCVVILRSMIRILPDTIPIVTSC